TLRPRPVKFYVVRLGQLSRSDITDDTYDFRRQTIAVIGAEQDLTTDRILIRKKLLGGRVAQDHDRRLIESVAFGQITPGEQYDRQADLPGDQTATEALLTAAATDRAAAIFQSIDQIGAGTLPRGIKAHDEAGHE